jgi:Adenylyl/Guanylyl and SMODS C-terminal sensor domain
LFSTLEIIDIFDSTRIVPEIRDPGLSDEIIRTGMTVGDYEKFIDSLRDLVTKLKQAIESPKEDAILIYQKIFNDSETHYFPSILSTLPNEKFDLIFDKSNEYEAQEYITNRGCQFKLSKEYYLRIKCSVLKEMIHAPQFRSFYNPLQVERGIALNKESKLKFIQTSNCPIGTSYYWKVVNNGDEAKHQRRGNIFKYTKGDESRFSSNIEQTEFKGVHSVTCFAVLDNKVIAMDIFHMRVK